jgi:cell division FtsZ-interacting protein ZapD
METLIKIKDLVEKMSVDTAKVYVKGNRSASIRARKYAQEIKELIPVYRKELLKEIKKQEKQLEKHGDK